jgi:hypothetical protein
MYRECCQRRCSFKHFHQDTEQIHGVYVEKTTTLSLRCNKQLFCLAGSSFSHQSKFVFVHSDEAYSASLAGE